MKYISYFLIPIVVGLISLLMRYRNKDNEEIEVTENSFKVYLPTITIWVGIVGSLIISVIIYFATTSKNGTAQIEVIFLFLFFVLLCLFLVYYGIRWRMIFHNGILKIRSIIGKEKEVSFRDIDKVKIKQNGIAVYSNGKKLFYAECSYVGYDILEKRLKDENIKFYQ